MKKPVCKSLHVESKPTTCGAGCRFGCVTVRGIVNLHNVQTHFIYVFLIYFLFYPLECGNSGSYTMCVCLLVCFVLLLFSFLDTVLWQLIFRPEYNVFFSDHRNVETKFVF